MSDPNQLSCLCEWSGEAGASWRRQALMGVRARVHRWQHNRQRRRMRRRQ